MTTHTHNRIAFITNLVPKMITLRDKLIYIYISLCVVFSQRSHEMISDWAYNCFSTPALHDIYDRSTTDWLHIEFKLMNHKTNLDEIWILWYVSIVNETHIIALDVQLDVWPHIKAFFGGDFLTRINA